VLFTEHVAVQAVISMPLFLVDPELTSLASSTKSPVMLPCRPWAEIGRDRRAHRAGSFMP
jgi:hypothetical protein